MANRDFIPLVADLVKESENYRDTLSADRIRATEYYDGIMKDTPSDTGRSSVVSRDAREQIQKVLPAMTRVFLASDKLVEFQPVSMGDEDGAEQATDYINGVILPECDGPKVITDAIHDALKLRNAVLHWWFEEKKEVAVSSHTGLDEASFAQITADDGVEVLEHSEREEKIEGPTGPELAVVHDLRLRRTVTKRAPCLACIPLEEFLIHPDALTEDTAPLIGQKTKLRRSDLVAMGYDKEKVAALPANGADGQQDEAEQLTRRQLIESGSNQVAPELQEIDYYKLLVRIDIDGDGIAELRHMCFGGAIGENGLLLNEEADDVCYAICAVKTRPHQWEGVSVVDDVQDIQRIKTVLLRSTLDNLYWQNNPQIAMARNAVENADAVTNPQFGQTIWLKEGYTVRDAIQPVVIPFFAKESMGMMDYLDREKQSRTGINEASGGMPPDALQNTTAKASSLIEQQGIGQAELMARTFAMGLRRAFKGLLKLIIKHQDKPRMVRLRNQWVAFDPRSWNAEMDCSINTGLGAGTRERDTATLMNVLAMQQQIMGMMGPQNPFVTPENFGTTLHKLAEASGLKTPEMYFTKPSAEEIQQQQEAQANQPPPEMLKIQAEVDGQRQIKELELNYETQFKQMEMEVSKHKEMVQSQAAVEERQAIAQIEAAAKQQELLLKKYEIDSRNEIEREKLRLDSAAKLAPLGMDLGEDGKPYDRTNKQLENLIMGLTERMEAMAAAHSKPRRVRTPEGEEFVMETFEPMTVN